MAQTQESTGYWDVIDLYNKNNIPFKNSIPILNSQTTTATTKPKTRFLPSIGITQSNKNANFNSNSNSNSKFSKVRLASDGVQPFLAQKKNALMDKLNLSSPVLHFPTRSTSKQSFKNVVPKSPKYGALGLSVKNTAASGFSNIRKSSSLINKLKNSKSFNRSDIVKKIINIKESLDIEDKFVRFSARTRSYSKKIGNAAFSRKRGSIRITTKRGFLSSGDDTFVTVDYMPNNKITKSSLKNALSSSSYTVSLNCPIYIDKDLLQINIDKQTYFPKTKKMESDKTLLKNQNFVSESDPNLTESLEIHQLLQTSNHSSNKNVSFIRKPTPITYKHKLGATVKLESPIYTISLNTNANNMLSDFKIRQIDVKSMVNSHYGDFSSLTLTNKETSGCYTPLSDSTATVVDSPEYTKQANQFNALRAPSLLSPTAISTDSYKLLKNNQDADNLPLYTTLESKSIIADSKELKDSKLINHDDSTQDEAFVNNYIEFILGSNKSVQNPPTEKVENLTFSAPDSSDPNITNNTIKDSSKTLPKIVNKQHLFVNSSNSSNSNTVLLQNSTSHSSTSPKINSEFTSLKKHSSDGTKFLPTTINAIEAHLYPSSHQKTENLTISTKLTNAIKKKIESSTLHISKPNMNPKPKLNQTKTQDKTRNKAQNKAQNKTQNKTQNKAQNKTQNKTQTKVRALSQTHLLNKDTDVNHKKNLKSRLQASTKAKASAKPNLNTNSDAGILKTISSSITPKTKAIKPPASETTAVIQKKTIKKSDLALNSKKTQKSSSIQSKIALVNDAKEKEINISNAADTEAPTTVSSTYVAFSTVTAIAPNDVHAPEPSAAGTHSSTLDTAGKKTSQEKTEPTTKSDKKQKAILPIKKTRQAKSANKSQKETVKFRIMLEPNLPTVPKFESNTQIVLKKGKNQINQPPSKARILIKNII